MAPALAALQGETRAASGGSGGFDSTPAAVGLGGLVGLGYRVRQYSQNRRRSKNAYVRLCMTVTMSEPLPKYPIKLTPEQAAHGGLGMTPRICRAPHIT